MKLRRFQGNPIVTPRKEFAWEANGTFNPGAVAEDGSIHLLYRAVDSNWISRLGYAKTVDGRTVNYRSPEPVLAPGADWEEFGCEDPRIIPLDGAFYVTYTAYSRRGPRIALASTKDFEHFEKYGLVGPDRNDKDCVIFPEKVNGRIAVLHRLEFKVQIAYFASLDALIHSENFWKGYVKNFEDYEVIRAKFPWEERKVGVGTPPIKTDRGWLVLYHGVSADRIYRAGAMLLDLDDPKKVVARTKEPILEPELDFEKYGVVPNVVFPDGAVITDGQLISYYGGADKVCCVASVPIDQFLDELEKQA